MLHNIVRHTIIITITFVWLLTCTHTHTPWRRARQVYTHVVVIVYIYDVYFTYVCIKIPHMQYMQATAFLGDIEFENRCRQTLASVHSSRGMSFMCSKFQFGTLCARRARDTALLQTTTCLHHTIVYTAYTYISNVPTYNHIHNIHTLL